MLGWLLTIGFVALTGGTGGLISFGVILGLALFFPRLVRFLFASVAFPVYTLWLSAWMLVLGWAFSVCPFSLDSFKSCIYISSIPVAIFITWCSDGVRTLAD